MIAVIHRMSSRVIFSFNVKSAIKLKRIVSSGKVEEEITWQ
ncbi:MAG: hypothetical protein MPEBLZ_03132 [Candidatus Methanoperedens nitroreducens]|uniref:Uncharacterized protein n=1 Tax=Candidatus Methanoperedens nitratireducens TaxID=1392998 RepID=A0A0P8C6E2_9EURY|nr:MAG: hypothetical protein MPEBLZ_03132 [Candidatus Methanoperedens sp. BLZ1]